MPLTQEQVAAALKGPAVYATQVTIQSGIVTRITFMEETEFRFAVVLPPATAIELANLLKTLLADVEASMQPPPAPQKTN